MVVQVEVGVTAHLLLMQAVALSLVQVAVAEVTITIVAAEAVAEYGAVIQQAAAVLLVLIPQAVLAQLGRMGAVTVVVVVTVMVALAVMERLEVLVETQAVVEEAVEPQIQVRQGLVRQAQTVQLESIADYVQRHSTIEIPVVTRA